jgi:hypothetical protein
MRIIALVQARLGSIRLPEKVLRQIQNKPLIELLLARLSCSTELDEIVVATSEEPQNTELQLFVESLGFQCTRGSEIDVLNRFYKSAKHHYTEALEYKKDYFVCYTNRALVCLKLEEPEQAIDDCTRVLEYQEVFNECYTQLPDLCYKALMRRG